MKGSRVDYRISITTARSCDEAGARTRETRAEPGLGVVTEIVRQATSWCRPGLQFAADESGSRREAAPQALTQS